MLCYCFSLPPAITKSEMRAKITKRLVDATGSADRDVFVWDTDIRGFGLKVSKGGAKTYIFQYRMGGRELPTRRFTIGPHGALTPTEARDRAANLRAKVSNGVDPGMEKAEERKRARAKIDAPITFGQLAKDYIDRECPKLARGEDIASVVRREILPPWDHRAIEELRKRDAIALTDALVDAGTPAAALKLYEVIKRIGNWLVERDQLEVSPFANMRPPAKKLIRDRSLRDQEVVALWSACTAYGYPFGPLVQLLLLTGQRRNEVAQMQWKELDLDAREWVIPAARTKNRKPHLVPLSDPAQDIIDSLSRFAGPYVFSSTSGQRPVSGFTKAKHRIDKTIAKAVAKEADEELDLEKHSLPEWRLHDLRRTCRTGMAALGVPEIVSEKMLNHQPATLARTYNVHDYADEKWDAMARWGRKVLDIITPPPANVVPMTFRQYETYRRS